MLAALALLSCAGRHHARQVVHRSTAVPVVAIAASAQVTLAHAHELDLRAEEAAVDLYYRAAVQSLQALPPCTAIGDATSEETYHLAISGMVDAAQRYRRFDPQRQLIVVDGGTRALPVRHFGFAWQPQDFSRLTSAKRHRCRDITHHYANPGLGLPLVGERIAACQPETFFRPWQPFAVTAVLQSADELVDQATEIPSTEYTLDLYNPLAVDAVAWGARVRPLARDLTAPLAAIVNEVPRQYLRGFTAPSDTSVQPQLVMVEPYQRGKFPLVFVHGLYSDPITWVDMANELRTQRDLYDRYQFWTFRYPTGGELLDSAAALRHNLQLARDTFDGDHTDPAMDAMVLVGHSLGGLLSKMQVTTSYDLLWREVALQPFDAVRAPPEIQARLARDFFFEPVPMVTRVIFIGTPHQGSGMARRLAGRVGSALVRYGSEEVTEYRQLIQDNPCVFKPYLQRHRPTTITLLDPDSPLLAGLWQMPVNGATRLHSIIGTGGVNALSEPGDGVVTVSSARHYGDSERFVHARHEMLHRHAASISEVAGILRVHAAVNHQANVAGVAP